MIHLDTSFLIAALIPDSPQDRYLRTWLRTHEELAVSAIVWAEFLCGPLAPQHVSLAAGLLREPVSFLAADANLAARLFNLAGRRRGSLVDSMIAATAMRQGATLATSNVKDFRRFVPHGLRLAET